MLSYDDLNDKQREAVFYIVEAKKWLFCLTGGPGTGKSASLGVAVSQLAAQHTSFILAAPTGKAARRMFELTGVPAVTVHRMLGYQADGQFSVDENNPLLVDVVIVDEASMVDTHLMAAIIRGIGHARLVLVGDANQLPSIGPGMVFADLISSGVVPVVELTEVHRAAADSWICQAAPQIKDGRMPSLEEVLGFAFWQEISLEACCQAAVQAAVLLRDQYGERALVITPRREGVAASTEDLNPMLQAALNPNGARTKIRLGSGEEVRVGDRVIQRKNDYELGVFNGEMGTVEAFLPGTALPPRRPGLLVRFDGRDESLMVPQDALRSFRLGYCVTCHSSQGSESPWCVVICHAGHGRMVSRQIFYTSITRAKVGLILVGNFEGVHKAVQNNKPVERRTALIQRLQGAL